MKNIIEVNPFRCRSWSEHERLEEYITEETCRTAIASISTNGQLIPVLARPVKDDPMYDLEVIYGARRLFVARHLNIPLVAEVKELTDQQAAIALDIENRQRKDVSPYERGLCYSRWLRAKYFGSQDEIARALGISAAQVSRTLKLARLPTVIITAFPSPADIAETWGLELYRAWHDERRQAAMIAAARALARESPRPSPENVYEQLMTRSIRELKMRAKSHDEVVKDAIGRLLFRVRYFRRSVAIVMDCERLTGGSLDQVKVVVTEALQHANAQVLGVSEKDRPGDLKPLPVLVTYDTKRRRSSRYSHLSS